MFGLENQSKKKNKKPKKSDYVILRDKWKDLGMRRKT